MDTIQKQFNDAYEQYSDALFRYCLYKISDRETAKDLLQEAFFRAWRHMSQGNTVDNIKAFLYKILGNVIIDQYRKRGPDDSLENMQEDGFDPGMDDTDRWIDGIDGTQAFGLLEDIPEPYRETIVLRYVNELSIREIASASHTSENAVAVRIHRGLGKLRTIFNEHLELKQLAH